MGLGGLLSRVGRGVQKAAPYIERGSAGVAAAYGNRAPLDAIRQRDNDEFSRAVTERGLARQDEMDQLAKDQAGRQAQEFESNQALSALQRTIAQRQADLQPKSREEEIQRATEDMQRAADFKRADDEKNAPDILEGKTQDAILHGGTPVYSYEPQTSPNPIPEVAALGFPTQSEPAKPVLQKVIPARDYLAEAQARASAQMAQLLAATQGKKDINNTNNDLKLKDLTGDQRVAAAKSAETKAGPINWMTMDDDEKETAIASELSKMQTPSPSAPSVNAGGAGAVPAIAPGARAPVSSVTIPPNPYRKPQAAKNGR